MKVSELQLLCKYDDSVMNEFKTCHPKQIASDMIPIPVSKIKYKYLRDAYLIYLHNLKIINSWNRFFR